MSSRPPASTIPNGFQSKSTPNLPTLRSLTSSQAEATTSAAAATTSTLTSPSEATSIEEFSLDATNNSLDSCSNTDDASSSEDEGQKTNPAASTSTSTTLNPRTMYTRRSQSHTYLGPATFAPPFYNRPPTPLPPSPSLTSLLRPTFSTQVSRPTTPDPSSDEGTPGANNNNGLQTPNSAAATTLTTSFRTAKPIPRASPKVPTYEYYGFILYLTSSLGFAIYLLWSFLPSPFLHQLGIYYYPNRWWSLAIPAWLVMLVVYIYIALATYNTGYLTLKLHAVECLVDEAANIAVVDSKGEIVRRDRLKTHRRDDSGKKTAAAKAKAKAEEHVLDWRTLWNEGTDAVMDVPIGGVCEILYGEREPE